MRDDEYRDPPLWTMVEMLAKVGPAGTTMSKLAAMVATSTKYTGAYRAIGRLVACGYAEYSAPPQSTDNPMRLGVKLSILGWRRYAAGREYPQVTAHAIRRRREGVDGIDGHWDDYAIV